MNRSAPTTAAAQDQRRLQVALSDRRSKSQEFFSSSAGQWDRLRDDLFGDRVHLAALAALADGDAVVGDLGCGTGQVSAALAPFVAQVIAVDARRRCCRPPGGVWPASTTSTSGAASSRRCRSTTQRLDVATLMLVLHHVPEPEKALAEVARVLKPGGRAIIGDMLPHDRESYRQQMGHVWLGFSDQHVRRLLSDAGFGRIRVVPLAPDPRVKGPGLFVATGTKTPGSGGPEAPDPTRPQCKS